jgi:hypothetical protein
MMTRTVRAEETRTKSERPKVWRPPSTLDAPPAPEGFVHRWIRYEVNGFDDRKNMSARLREGYELVRADEYPERDDLPSIQDGKHAGVIAVGGLVLARIPQELVNQRTAYYRKMAGDQITAVDNDLMRESNPNMPIQKPDRQSRVTFGGPRSS